ncbi:Uncharacterised protein [Bordetella pertussis]|nr:Uncharacterised protein [Bordetella pertussis]CFW30015.1 Uncharacterised protein [Bordetella pertussis]
MGAQPVTLSTSANSISGRSGGQFLSVITSFLHSGSAPPALLSNRFECGNGGLRLAVALQRESRRLAGDCGILAPALRSPSCTSSQRSAEQRHDRRAPPSAHYSPERHSARSSNRRLRRP